MKKPWHWYITIQVIAWLAAFSCICAVTLLTN